jgi:hypothetical protein
MCLIVRGRVSDLLNLDLARAQSCNSDGWGIHTSRKVRYSFDIKDYAIEDTLCRISQNAVATIHFRFATHGTVDRDNCHPFDLGGGDWLMHNGVLSGDHFDHEVMSDTHMLARALRDCGRIGRDTLLRTISESDSYYGNRFCVLSGTEWQHYGTWHFDKKTQTFHSNKMLLTTFGEHWKPKSKIGYSSDPFYADDYFKA